MTNDMSKVVPRDESIPILARPFSYTRSQLGVTTKILSDRFVVDKNAVRSLTEDIVEKVRLLSPQSATFQFLISFNDETHFEHDDIEEFDRVADSNSKTTEKLLLKWDIVHSIEGTPNELTIVVRISNPMNPFIFMQAVFSKSPEELEAAEFMHGTVSITLNGAGQILAEEIFALVSNWVHSCPQPAYLTNIHKLFEKHSKKIEFLNFWLLPVLVSAIFFTLLWKMELGELLFPVLFLGVVSTYYVRNIASSLNRRISKWLSDTGRFCLFSITGGDSNEQNKHPMRAKKSTIKVTVTTVVTFVLNIVAGITVVKLLS